MQFRNCQMAEMHGIKVWGKGLRAFMPSLGAPPYVIRRKMLKFYKRKKNQRNENLTFQWKLEVRRQIMKEKDFESRIQTIRKIWEQSKDIFRHETTQKFCLQTWTYCVGEKRIIQGSILAQCKMNWRKGIKWHSRIIGSWMGPRGWRKEPFRK